MGNTLLPQPIDALSGRELDAAIQREFGYETQTGNVAWKVETTTIYFAGQEWLEVPCYSTDIAVAWTLDGDGWKWYFEETSTIEGDKLRVWSRADHRRISDTVEVKFCDFSTKSIAYATARCRAWLKARLAIGE